MMDQAISQLLYVIYYRQNYTKRAVGLTHNSHNYNEFGNYYCFVILWHFCRLLPSVAGQVNKSVISMHKDWYYLCLYSDKLFPALGFGAKLSPHGPVSHEFFLVSMFSRWFRSLKLKKFWNWNRLTITLVVHIQQLVASVCVSVFSDNNLNKVTPRAMPYRTKIKVCQ